MNTIRITSLLILALAGCGAGKTAPGLETEGLGNTVEGTLVVVESLGGLDLIQLPSRERTTLLKPAPQATADRPLIRAASGPDKNGRIAYVEDFYQVAKEERHHVLKTIQMDGTQVTEIFSRPGSPMSSVGRSVIGTYLSLSPKQGRVAFISRTSGKQMPEALLREGHLEVWDIATKKPLATSVIALDERLAWFENGDRLVYSALVPREELVNVPGLDVFGEYTGGQKWDMLPAIFLLNLDSGESELLCVGWFAIVSADSQELLVGGWGSDGYTWRIVNLQSKSITGTPRLPGQCGPAIAALEKGMVLYWALPTAGSEVQYSPYGSPLRGRTQLVTIKVADIESGAFETVVPFIDPRRNVSFGTIRRDEIDK